MILECVGGFVGACVITVAIGLGVRRLRDFMDWMQGL
jgi:hypothetical protein